MKEQWIGRMNRNLQGRSQPARSSRLNPTFVNVWRVFCQVRGRTSSLSFHVLFHAAYPFPIMMIHLLLTKYAWVHLYLPHRLSGRSVVYRSHHIPFHGLSSSSLSFLTVSSSASHPLSCQRSLSHFCRSSCFLLLFFPALTLAKPRWLRKASAPPLLEAPGTPRAAPSNRMSRSLSSTDRK